MILQYSSDSSQNLEVTEINIIQHILHNNDARFVFTFNCL